MSTEVNPTAQSNAGGIDEILNKYLNEGKGGDPASSSSAAPLNFRFGNEQLSVKSVEDLQKEVDARMAQIAQAYQNERAQWQSQLNSYNNQPPPATTQVPQSVETKGDDPVEFVQKLVSDPRGTLESALGDRLNRINELETRLEKQSFTMAHPMYGSDPRIMQGLQTLCEKQGMPLTASNLEMAASWAVSQRLLPSEDTFREQQRQQLLQAIAQNGNATPGGNVVQMPPPQGIPSNSPHAQYMAPLPPPSTSGVTGSTVTPNQIEMASQMADKMSLEDLKNIIYRAGGSI